MSGSDNSPNFDWMNRDIARQPDPVPPDSVEQNDRRPASTNPSVTLPDASKPIPRQTEISERPLPEQSDFQNDLERTDFEIPAFTPPAENSEHSDSAILDEVASGATDPDQHPTDVFKSADVAAIRQNWPAIQTPPTEKAKLANTAQAHVAGMELPAGPSRLFVFLATYASAITIAFLALLLKQMWDSGHPHQLESLPDLPAQKPNELTYVAPGFELPKGHTLQLGESRRFGNILVEPLRVVREPVEFAHYTGDVGRTRPPSNPVWKLYLRLTNVSADQDIAPLDRGLVLRWVNKAGRDQDYSNYFVVPAGVKDRNAHVLQLYHLPPDGEWDLRQQDLGRVLKPGESYETFLATSEEDTDQLPSNLVWQVQIRKGYSSQGNGVTTVFQVPFTKDDIESGARIDGA